MASGVTQRVHWSLARLGTPVSCVCRTVCVVPSVLCTVTLCSVTLCTVTLCPVPCALCAVPGWRQVDVCGPPDLHDLGFAMKSFVYEGFIHTSVFGARPNSQGKPGSVGGEEGDGGLGGEQGLLSKQCIWFDVSP